MKYNYLYFLVKQLTVIGLVANWRIIPRTYMAELFFKWDENLLVVFTQPTKY